MIYVLHDVFWGGQSLTIIEDLDNFEYFTHGRKDVTFKLQNDGKLALDFNYLSQYKYTKVKKFIEIGSLTHVFTATYIRDKNDVTERFIGVYEISDFILNYAVKAIVGSPQEHKLTLVFNDILEKDEATALSNPTISLILVRLWHKYNIFLDREKAQRFSLYSANYFLNKNNSNLEEAKKLIEKLAKEDKVAKWLLNGLNLVYEDEECPILFVQTDCDPPGYDDYYFYSPCKDLDLLYKKCVKRFNGCGHRYDGSQASFSEEHDDISRCTYGEYYLMGCNYHYYDHPGNDN